MGNTASKPLYFQPLTPIFYEKTIDFCLENMIICYGCPGYAYLARPSLAIKAGERRREGG